MAQDKHQQSPLLKRWVCKFARAGRGFLAGIAGQSSFVVHVPAAILVVVLGIWLGLDLPNWCLLILCITMVIGAELFNSSLECLAHIVTEHEDPQVGKALDIASGAVSAFACGAAIVGVLVLGTRLWQVMGGV